MTAERLPEWLRCDEAPVWADLRAKFEADGARFDLRRAFELNARRFDRFSQRAPHLFVDMSKNLIDEDTEAMLLELAHQCGVLAQRDAMLAGAAINSTEGRAALHVALRRVQPAEDSWHLASDATRAEIDQIAPMRDAMLRYAERIRADSTITDVVSIGIGGSDLGPHMMTLALDSVTPCAKRMHFVSNVDGHELDTVLRQVRAQNTLFVIASKTFTTLETMTNARSARSWYLAQGGDDVARHFAALTTNIKAAAEFGVETVFGFWDWVGGRYSMWSSIGLPIAIAHGAQAVSQMLAGAREMDAHFASAPPEQNLPLRLALLDVWYRAFHGFTSRCVAPYHFGLRRLPAHLQQLEMESNGKRVDRRGRALSYGSSPVIWGEPGTNGQHAFFQMLHQGTDVIPVEFVAIKREAHKLPGHHRQLLANALAQAQALMCGRQDPGGHKNFPGNRPSTFFVLDRLDPASLGALLALYEHRVFCAAAVWGINAFDQWGVELGKVLAKDLVERFASGDDQGLDPSTLGLLMRLRD